MLIEECENEGEVGDSVENAHLIGNSALDISWVFVVNLDCEVGQNIQTDQRDEENDSDRDRLNVLRTMSASFIIKVENLLVSGFLINERHCHVKDQSKVAEEKEYEVDVPGKLGIEVYEISLIGNTGQDDQMQHGDS